MIKSYFSLILLLSFTGLPAVMAGSGEFHKKASAQPELVQTGTARMWCPVCGMNLKMFYKTSHVAQNKTTGEHRQYCSMRCLLVDMDQQPGLLEGIQVVDAASEKLVDAAAAYYVLGSNVPGTMAKRSKIAFAEKANAEAFAASMGGTIVDFKTALDAAKQSLETDIAMTNKKKQKKMYPMGKKIFESLCDPSIDLKKYRQINELKADIASKKLCGELNPKKLQAVCLYLWEVKRMGHTPSSIASMKITKDEKCPVCGMFVYKYPRWAAQLQYKDHQGHFSFDGVKDLLKFYFEPEKWSSISAVSGQADCVWVTDYYSQKTIDGKQAYYVIGSDILGPMGHELIPFLNKHDAATFLNDHKGRDILTFNQITLEKVVKLDR
ncbi:MAG: nitrous oxide reductase [Acidobacteria bacterium]|nr:MAG: nitrous oxide reductase [Acidobacteriota bacterium]